MSATISPTVNSLRNNLSHRKLPPQPPTMNPFRDDRVWKPAFLSVGAACLWIYLILFNDKLILVTVVLTVAAFRSMPTFWTAWPTVERQQWLAENTSKRIYTVWWDNRYWIIFFLVFFNRMLITPILYNYFLARRCVYNTDCGVLTGKNYATWLVSTWVTVTLPYVLINLPGGKVSEYDQLYDQLSVMWGVILSFMSSFMATRIRWKQFHSPLETPLSHFFTQQLIIIVTAVTMTYWAVSEGDLMWYVGVARVSGLTFSTAVAFFYKVWQRVRHDKFYSIHDNTYATRNLDSSALGGGRVGGAGAGGGGGGSSAGGGTLPWHVAQALLAAIDEDMAGVGRELHAALEPPESGDDARPGFGNHPD